MATQVILKMTSGDPDSKSVMLEDFVSVCHGLINSLRVSERSVTNESGKLSFPMASLEHGSDCVAIAVPRDVKDHFQRTVSDIEAGRAVDLSDDDLRNFRQLSYPLLSSPKHISAIEIAGIAITAQFAANIDKWLHRESKSRGSLSGRLERYDSAGSREFWLHPASGGSVKCCFDESLLSDAEHNLARFVTVYGEVTRSPDGHKPISVCVNHLEPHEDDDELPTFDHLRGILSRDALQGKSSTEFVRFIRDEQG